MFRNFLTGMGSILELCPPRRDSLQFPKPLSDEEAIATDWEAVGGDFLSVMDKDSERRKDN